MLRLHAHHACCSDRIYLKYVFSLDHKIIGLQYYFLAQSPCFWAWFLDYLSPVWLGR
jgi:hypothetical protein